MSEVVEFLRACLAEDERIARRATVRQAGGEAWSYTESEVKAASGLNVTRRIVPVHGEFIAEHDPARVLREIDTKRQILALHVPRPGQHPDFCWHDKHELPCPTLRLLALPYADREGYQEGWAP